MINYFLSHFLPGAKFNADNIPSNRWSVGEDTMVVNLSFLEEEAAISLFRHVETCAGEIAVVRVSTYHHQGLFLFKLTAVVRTPAGVA